MKNFPRLAGRSLALLLVLGGLGLSSCKKDSTTTVYGNWINNSTFPGPQRSNAVSFVLSNIAYVGTGLDASNGRLKDFYSFDPSKNNWQTVTPFPGANRNSAVAFTVGNYGYVGSGYDGRNALNDFWRFTPKDTSYVNANGQSVTTRGVWKRVADFPLSSNNLGLFSAVAASVGNYGYVGCGTDGLSTFNTFQRFDPSKNMWTPIASGSTDKAVNAVAFTVNNIMYVGTGLTNGANSVKFSAYDPAKDTWTAKNQLANISNSTGSYDNSRVARTQAVAFTIGNYGYIATGSNGAVTNTCFQYDPTQDTWTAMGPFPGTGRNAAVGFSIGNFGYVGTGYTGSIRLDDFWTFDPNVTQQ